MVQVPVVFPTETVFPDTVQMAGVVEAKLTESPEVAEALRLTEGEFIVTLVRGWKLMVCALELVMVNVRMTGVAAAQVESPDWLAVIEHVPALVNMSAFPFVAQTPRVVDVKLTGKPEDDDADSVSGLEAIGTFGSGAKVIVWGVPGPHAVNVLPLTVVVLLPLTKFGTFALAPMGAKLIVAVMAFGEAVTAPAAAER